MHRKHLILAGIYARFISMQASHLNWPLTNRPAAMLHVLCHKCQHLHTHIFTLGNCRLLPVLQTLFAQFLKFIRPLHTVFCARLLKLIIAFLVFVLRLISPGNKLHHFLTGQFVRWWFFTWTLRRGSFSVRELHQIGESCWSNGDGACVWDRITCRGFDDSVIIGGDNKHCFAGRRRARRRWRGCTRVPPPGVLQTQHRTETNA